MSRIRVSLKYKIANIQKNVKEKMHKRIIGLSSIMIIIYCLYMIFTQSVKFSLGDLLVFSTSVFFSIWGVCGIISRGIHVSYVFAMSYFLFLSINCFRLSSLQIDKNLKSFYYLIVGAFFFVMLIYVFERCKVKKIKKFVYVKPDISALGFLFLFIVVKILIYGKTGIRLLDSNYQSGVGGEYTVGGLSGIAELTMWISLMYIPYVKKINKLLIALVSFILHGVFSLSRNNMILVIVFLLLCFIYEKGNIFFTKKNIRKMLLVCSIVLLFFASYGNYRQIQRGWDNPTKTIQYLLQSKTDNSVINWLYSYTAINYDVLLQCMTECEHPYTMYSIFAPLSRFVSDTSGLLNYIDAVSHIKGLNGYNASTIFGPMVYELGGLYIFGAIALGMIVGILIYIARMENADGLKIYLMLWAAMSVFGNYYTITLYFFIAIIACIVFAIIGEKENAKDV